MRKTVNKEVKRVRGGSNPPATKTTRKPKTHAAKIAEFAARANATPEKEPLAKAELVRMGWNPARTRWLLIPHPPTAVGLNGNSIMWARRAWWPVLEEGTRSQLIRQGISTENPPQEYHVAWYYKIGVEPDDDNVWGRLKHVRDTIAAHFGIDDRHLHTGRCRSYKNKELAGYCMIILT